MGVVWCFLSLWLLSTWQRQDRTRSPEAIIRHPSNESRARLSQHTGIFSFNPSKGDTAGPGRHVFRVTQPHWGLRLEILTNPCRPLGSILVSRLCSIRIRDPGWHQENCYKEEFWHKNMIRPQQTAPRLWNTKVKILHNTQSDTKSTGSQITRCGECAVWYFGPFENDLPGCSHYVDMWSIVTSSQSIWNNFSACSAGLVRPRQAHHSLTRIRINKHPALSLRIKYKLNWGHS